MSHFFVGDIPHSGGKTQDARSKRHELFPVSCLLPPASYTRRVPCPILETTEKVQFRVNCYESCW